MLGQALKHKTIYKKTQMGLEKASSLPEIDLNEFVMPMQNQHKKNGRNKDEGKKPIRAEDKVKS